MGVAYRLSGINGSGEIFTENGDVIKRAIKGRLEQTGEHAVDGVAQILREENEEIAALAREYAPFSEEGEAAGWPHLEDAIETREERVGRRLAFVVFVNGRRTGHNGKSVGQYAHMVHEGMLPEGSGEINRGKGTTAKGPQAGGKFLERAFRDRSKRTKERVEARAKSFFRKR